MATIIKPDQVEMKHIEPSVKDFTWSKSEKLNKLVASKDYIFDLKTIEPGYFSYPYHYHYNAEEIFVILDGSITLRTPQGFTELKKDDIIFFETGPNGAHQLFNHSDKSCTYLDIRSSKDLDVCAYPDSEKINIMNDQVEISLKGQTADYFYGENQVKKYWQEQGYVFT